MTREEARIVCERIREGFIGDIPREALYMAIEALQERPKGRWIADRYCLNCNYDSTYLTSNFCPNCGASMRESEQE